MDPKNSREEQLIKKQKKFKVSNISKILVLLLSPFIATGNFYVFDTPQFLAPQLIKIFSQTQEEFNLNYTLLYTACILMLLITPKLMAKTSSSSLGIISTSCIFYGTVLSFYGVYSKNNTFMLIGRGIMGLGTEACTVANYSILEEWFKGGLLTFAGGLTGTVNFASAAASSFTTLPIFLKYRDANIPFFVCGLVSAGSVVISILIFFLDFLKGRKRDEFMRELRGEVRKLDEDSIGITTGEEECYNSILKNTLAELNVSGSF